MFGHYTYLVLDLFTLLGPLALSFERWHFHFRERWRFLFPGILAMAAIYVPWDIAFTEAGFWGFNPDYLTGIFIGNLPLEEWLFFLAVPYACLFIYEAVRFHIRRDPFVGTPSRVITWALIVGLAVLAAIYHDRWYTALTFSLCVVLLLYHALRKTAWLSRFYFAYLFILIPFLIVNGILTGTGIDEQVVWYNNAENLGVRLLTIPVEDTVYNLLMLLIVATVYEGLSRRAMAKGWVPFSARAKKENGL